MSRTTKALVARGVLSATLTLALALPAAHAADYTRAQINSFNWEAADNWSPNGVPGATDRAIFATVNTMSASSPVSVGQLVFLGPTSGTNGGSFGGPTMTIYGIGGVGIDQQATNLSRAWNRTIIASDQIWRASNAAGGGIEFNSFGSGITYVDLGSHTLTIDLVNAANVARLPEVRGTGNIVKTGSGTLTLLSGTSTYTGSTLVQAGTVALSGAGIISTSSLVNVASGATFDIAAITAASTSIRSLAGGGTVVLGSKGLTLTSANHEFSGVIGGTGGLTIAGGTQILSGVNTYSGGTSLNGSVLSIAADNALGDAAGGLTFNSGTLRNTAAFTSARAINNPGSGTLQTDADLTLSGTINGGATLTKIGEATLTRTGTGAPATWNLLGGTLSVSSVGQMGTFNTNFGGGTLRVTAPVTYTRSAVLNAGGGTFRTDADLTWMNTISGVGSLTKTGAATLTLGGTLALWSGGTTITEGTLQIGNGGVTGGLPGNVLNNATLAFNKTNALTVGGLISGSGALIQRGTGTTTLTGNNTYTGATRVDVGTLRINGDQSAATGLVSVASGATLGGIGTIGGAVTVADGGHIAPGNSPGTLTMGTLSLSAGSILDFELGEANVAGGTYNDLINVNGDLTLDGTLNVALSAGGTYGAGIYRLINYTGALTDNGLDLGLMPATSTNYVQTSVANQVNLINSQGLVLNYWDGAAATRNDGQIAGGDGTWIAAPGNDNWALADGSINAPHQDAAMAIFTGTAGTVTVDASLGNIGVSGMQFASDGYRLQGDAITLNTGGNAIRVGDGSDAGAAFTATIAAELTGAGTLEKTDLGTLVLTGENTYSGGTTISAGTLQLGDGGTSGSLAGDVTNNGTFVLNRSDALTFGGVISGGGVMRQSGAGTTVLTGAGSTVGGLEIEHGTLEIASGANLAAVSTTIAAGTTLRNDGMFTGTAGDNAFTLAGSLIGHVDLLDGNDHVQIAQGADFSQATFEGGAGVDMLDLTYSGALALPETFVTGFEHLVKHGAGALTLAGTVDGFSDSITVSEGSLQLSGANVVTNELRIESGVTVTGTGSLSGGLINAGILSPGNSPGVIHVAGSSTQTTGGTLISEITRAGTDLLDVSGAAMLAGTHQIQVEYGLYLDGTTHTLLQAAGGITGNFDSVQINPSALMTASHASTANAATVSFARVPVTSLTDPNSGRGRFAAWLEEQISGGSVSPDMTSYIDSLLQQPTAEGAIALLGEHSEPAATMSQNSVSMLGAGFARTVFERFTMSDAAQCAPTQSATNDTLSCFWAHGLRQWGNAGGDARYDWITDGGQIGVDRNLSSGWAVGATFGYADTNTSDPNGGRNDARSKIGGLYTNYAAGRLNLGAMAFYSGNDNETHRTVLVGSTAQQARAEFDTDSYGVGVRLGYRLTSEAGPLVRPFIEAFYDHLEATAFSETEAGAGNLSANVHGRDGLRGTVGLQLAENFEGYGRVFRPAIELGVVHQFADVRSTLDLQPFSDAPAFRTYGPALDRTAYIARASLNVSLGNNASIALGYGGELSDDYSQHEGNLSFRVAW